jgi:protein pelota
VVLGTAAFCLLSQHMTVVLQRIDVPVPRKRAGSATAHDKGLARFYDTLYQSFLRHIPYANPTLRAIVIASPGWVRDAVFDYIMTQATQAGNKTLLGARQKFLRVHVNSPHVHSLVEVLKSPEVSSGFTWKTPTRAHFVSKVVSRLKETKFAREGIMLDRYEYK